MKRAMLFKMKNGRHRVVADHLLPVIQAGQADVMRQLEREMEERRREQRDAINVIAELRKKRDIYEDIVKRLSLDFGDRAGEAIKALIANSHRRDEPFASFEIIERSDIANRRVKMHKGVIPQIVYAFMEEE